MSHPMFVEESIDCSEHWITNDGVTHVNRRVYSLSDFIRQLVHFFQFGANFQVEKINRSEMIFSYNIPPERFQGFKLEGIVHQIQTMRTRVASSPENMDIIIEILYWLNQPNNCLGLNQQWEDDEPIDSGLAYFDENNTYGQKPSWALFHLISRAICYTERDLPQSLKLGLEAYGLKFSDIFSWSILYPRLIPELVAVMDLWFENPTKTFKQMWEDLGM